MKSLKLKAEPHPNAKVPPLNYRHHFHAGNFADLMKHALWLQLLTRLTDDPQPLTVIDTHAGAGLYDLRDAMAQRSKEAEAGVVRLMADRVAPAIFAPLKAAVLAENPDGELRFYPGSPLLTLGALRAGDDYIGCELRADDQAVLQDLLTGRSRRDGPSARTALADGYLQLSVRPGPTGLKTIHLIDPPFERGDEYAEIITGVGRALSVDRNAVFAIWAPLKDLETFDALLRGLEALRPASLVAAETRLRPLTDPMKMNGSAMIFINAPDIHVEAMAICAWVVERCGAAGGKASVRTLAG